MRNPSWMLALALVACAHENEPEAVEPETTATSGSVMQGPPSPQASAPSAPSSAPIEEHSMQQQYGAYRDPEVSSGRALHTRIHEALRSDSRVDEGTIAVSVDGTVVYLGGRVANEAQRDLAGTIAAQVPGVTQVFTHALRVGS